MYVHIINNTGSDVSNVKFDLSYNSSNKSKLSSSSIEILSNDEKGASLKCKDTIPNRY